MRYRNRSPVTASELLAAIACLVSAVRLLGTFGADSLCAAVVREAAGNGELVYTLLSAEYGGVGEYISETDPSPALIISDEKAVSEVSSTPEAAAPEQELAPEAVAESESRQEAVVPREYSPEDAELVTYTNETDYSPDTLALLQEPLEMELDASDPVVLIVHTHASESFQPDYEGQYEMTDTFRTRDTEYSVVGLGSILADRLEAQGIGVIHDTTISDYPSYTGSYSRSLEVIEKNLREYPSIQIVIDLHRDAAGDADAPVASYYKDGISQLMLVVGTDQGGLQHPDWRENLKLALRFQVEAEKLYPGLMRPLNLRQERFNQHLTYGSLILEVGFAGNKWSEAVAATELWSEVMAEVMEQIAAGGG